MPRLKLKLDPGHPERMRHDFKLGNGNGAATARQQRQKPTLYYLFGASSAR